MSSFLKLSAELKLAIIELLVPERSAHQPSCSTQPRRLKTSLDKNPLRTQWSVENVNWELGFADEDPSCDLRHLSCVNRELRELSAPLLFRNITLRCNERSGASVRAVAEGDLAKHVRVLHYEPEIEHLIPSETSEGHDWIRHPVAANADHFPECVKSILENLRKFPELEILTVEFILSDEAFQLEPGLMHLFTAGFEPETIEERDKAEQTEAWRAVMKKSYNAISKNAPGQVKALELRNVIPQQVSSWLQSDWHKFLGGVQSFAITLRGGANSIGQQLGTCPEYPKLTRDLDIYFFDHLANVINFKFAATLDGPVGCEGTDNHTKFPIRPDHFPQLQSLHLAYVFIDKQLLEAIIGHNETLQMIRLDDCCALDTSWCSEEYRNPNDLSWAELFKGLQKTSMKKLRKFIVDLPTMPKLMHGWDKTMEKLHKGNPGKIIFVYCQFGDKYADFWIDEDHSDERADQGEDDDAWHELQRSGEPSSGEESGSIYLLGWNPEVE